MRQEHETAISFNELKKITQAIQAQKARPHSREFASQSTPKPKTRAHAKKGALKPIKKAFSERQITAFRDNSQSSANLKSVKLKQTNNANAFKTEQANNSNLRAKPSNKAFKPGLATHQEKGGSDE